MNLISRMVAVISALVRAVDDTGRSNVPRACQEEEDQPMIGACKSRIEQVAPIILEQFQIAHRKQHELLPGIAAFGWFDRG